MTITKDSLKVKAGKASARVRWGDPGVVRLDELTAAQRRLVMALVDAARAERQRTASLEAA